MKWPQVGDFGWPSGERKIWIGVLPFGYTFNKKTSKVEIVEEEAKIYRQMVEMYLRVGTSLNDVALWLDKKQIRTRRGDKWDSSNISHHFKRTIYYGYYVANTKVMSSKSKVIGLKPETEHIIWDDIPPIISRQQFDDVQSKLKDGKARVGSKFKFSDNFMLHDLLRCGLCGSMVVPYKSAPSHRERRYYICRNHKVGVKERELQGFEKCSLPSIPAQLLDDWIWDQLTVELGMNKEKAFSRFLETENFQEKIHQEEEAIASIKKTIAQKERLKRRLKEQMEMAEEDDFNPTEWRFEQKQIQNELVHLRKDQEEAENRLREIVQMRDDNVKFQELLGQEALLSSIWLKIDEADLKSKQKILAGMLSEPVKIYPSNDKWKVDPVKSKPKFNWKFDTLADILDLDKSCHLSGR